MTNVKRATSQDFIIGYIIGLIVGEGSFSGDKKQPCLHIRMNSDDPEPIALIQQVLGGKTYHYIRTGKDGVTRNFHDYLLRGEELKSQIKFFDENLIVSRKRRQFDAWIIKYNLSEYLKGYSGKTRGYSRAKSKNRID